jgi:hypothetical protein
MYSAHKENLLLVSQICGMYEIVGGCLLSVFPVLFAESGVKSTITEWILNI